MPYTMDSVERIMLLRELCIWRMHYQYIIYIIILFIYDLLCKIYYKMYYVTLYNESHIVLSADIDFKMNINQLQCTHRKLYRFRF